MGCNPTAGRTGGNEGANECRLTSDLAIFQPAAATGTGLACLQTMHTAAPFPIEKHLKRYYPALFHSAMLLHGNPAKAMLLTQQTFRLAVELSRALPIPANIRAWLFAILFHHFLETIPRGRRA